MFPVDDFVYLIGMILAQKHRLFVMADEVYQENVYLDDSKFFSFKKVMMDLGAPFNQMPMGKNMESERNERDILFLFVFVFQLHFILLRKDGMASKK